ncbi:MAG TPA: hypothetical protein VMU75_04735 [Acidimicrobiales bacterium]|nr:hypothetical protein [Acidimicrobiales bacterium]
MTSLTDDQLLEALGEALRPPPIRPGAVEVARLQLAVAEPRRLRPHLRASVTLAAAAAVVIIVGALAVSGMPLPSPLRSIAVSIGLPVNDAQVAAVKGDLVGLSRALTANDRSAVGRGAAVLRSKLADLTPGDRPKVEAAARSLLARADHLLATPSRRGSRSGVGGPGPTTTTTVAPTTTTAAAATTTAAPTTTTAAPTTTTVAPTTTTVGGDQPGSAPSGSGGAGGGDAGTASGAAPVTTSAQASQDGTDSATPTSSPAVGSDGTPATSQPGSTDHAVTRAAGTSWTRWR